MQRVPYTFPLYNLPPKLRNFQRSFLFFLPFQLDKIKVGGDSCYPQHFDKKVSSPYYNSAIEKLFLCLYFSCIKLKYYIKPVDVYVSSHFDVIKHMLSKPILHSRIGKWALALTEYSLIFQPLKAMKGQIVSDFIVDHAVVENHQHYVDLKPWKLYFDGSTHREGTGVGMLIISPDGIPTKLKYKIEGPLCSNNEAEY